MLLLNAFYSFPELDFFQLFFCRVYFVIWLCKQRMMFDAYSNTGHLKIRAYQIQPASFL